MSSYKNLKIVGFVGLPGSGKSAAVDYVTTKSYPKVYFGGVLYEAMHDAGIERGDWDKENDFRVSIRREEGDDFIVKRIIKQIHDLADAGQHRILADGIYSWAEYKAMKREFPGELTIIAVVTPKHIRHHRLAIRAERPLTDAEANERDWREIEDIQKGGPIAIADHYIINDGSLEAFHQAINQHLQSISFFNH